MNDDEYARFTRQARLLGVLVAVVNIAVAGVLIAVGSWYLAPVNVYAFIVASRSTRLLRQLA